MAISKRLDREIQRWEKREDEDDDQWESRVYRGARAAALQLLCTSKALRWGGDDDVINAEAYVRDEAQRHAEVFCYRPPPTPRRDRIARKTLASGLVRAVFDRDGWECVQCDSHRELTVDHKIPLVLGGTDDPENLQTLCKSCNSRKGARV